MQRPPNPAGAPSPSALRTSAEERSDRLADYVDAVLYLGPSVEVEVDHHGVKIVDRSKGAVTAHARTNLRAVSDVGSDEPVLAAGSSP